VVLRAVIGLAVGLVLAAPCFANRPLLRSYLTFTGGVDALLGEVGGDVLDSRWILQTELGIGYQLRDRLLIEGVYGWLGRYDSSEPYRPLTLEDAFLPAHRRTHRLTMNPLLFRLRYARSGMRTGYFKPELSLGVGWVQVTRWLRNFPNIPPEETSQLLPAVELGVSGLWVWSRNFMGYAGGRLLVTRRDHLVADLRHADGASLLLGFRIFLPSPRDAADEP
jgi:hypothetical protein